MPQARVSPRCTGDTVGYPTLSSSPRHNRTSPRTRSLSVEDARELYLKEACRLHAADRMTSTLDFWEAHVAETNARNRMRVVEFIKRPSPGETADELKRQITMLPPVDLSPRPAIVQASPAKTRSKLSPRSNEPKLSPRKAKLHAVGTEAPKQSERFPLRPEVSVQSLRAAQSVIVAKINDKFLRLDDAFKFIDTDRDNRISRNELFELLNSLNLSFINPLIVESLFDLMDADKSGKVEFARFAKVMVAKDIVSLAPFRETGFYAGEAAGFVGDIPLWRRDMDSHQAGILYPQHAHLSSEA